MVVFIFPKVLAFTFSVNCTVLGIFHVRGKLQILMLYYVKSYSKVVKFLPVDTS